MTEAGSIPTAPTERTAGVFRIPTLRQLAAVVMAAFAASFVAILLWQAWQQRQDDWLMECALRVHAEMDHSAVVDVFGRPADSESVQSVLFRNGQLLSADNPQVKDTDAVEPLQLSVWHGGFHRVTVVTNQEGQVRGQMMWSTRRRVTVWQRFKRRLVTLFL